MQLRKWAQRAFGCFTVAGLLGAWASIGCGGIGPGDYLMYRVASSEIVRSGDCAPTNDGDSSTFRTSATFVLYAGPEEKFYLDVGQATLEGTSTDDGFKFAGDSVDVEDIGGPNDTRTETNKTTISIKVDGAAVSGTAVTSRTVKYKCTDPTQCPENDSCTMTSKFVGSLIDNVALQHDPI